MVPAFSGVVVLVVVVVEVRLSLTIQPPTEDESAARAERGAAFTKELRACLRESLCADPIGRRRSTVDHRQGAEVNGRHSGQVGERAAGVSQAILALPCANGQREEVRRYAAGGHSHHPK
jgi:hypothetical protein